MIISNDASSIIFFGLLAGRSATERQAEVASMSRWLSGLPNPILLLFGYWQKSGYTAYVFYI
ncbi:hypothetical protein [Algoriphagus sp. Y33]|uniref:hypothetical protein n=1 Tax=Algoriphagus sp. Y33 TaxID=2772483 RepID=UPI00177B1A88|nr:hypothetical protein [Algoriphagus sp. Y33]